MIDTSTCHYVHDSSYNLLASTRQGKQGDHLSRHASSRLFPNSFNNQAVPATLSGNAFDRAGNMLQTPTLPRLSWDVTNMMQTTTQAANALGQANREFYTYTASQSRTRKVSETTNRSGNVIEITISLYFGMVEKRSTYKGADLSYDGVDVYEQGQRKAPDKAETDLRIMDMTGDGHRQVARQRTTVAHKERETTVEFFASNHIDSDQLRVSVNGEIVSYQNYRPFGTVAWQYGTTRANHYGYSGQETDGTGLSYYGSRYYCPELRRWLSCDKAGDADHTLNRYAFVRGNPITFRDVRGFVTDTEWILLGISLFFFLYGLFCFGCAIYMSCCQLKIRTPVAGRWHVYSKYRGSGCAIWKISGTRTWFYHGNDDEGQRIERMIRTTGKETLKSLIDALNSKTLAPELDIILQEGFGTQYANVFAGIKDNFEKIYNAFFNEALDLRPYGSHMIKSGATSYVQNGVTTGNITRLARGCWYNTKESKYAKQEQIAGPNKIPSGVNYWRRTDDALLATLIHELVHNDTGGGIHDHQYDYREGGWWNITKDEENNVIGWEEEVSLDNLNPQKTVKNPDSYGYVATAWKRWKKGNCGSPPALTSGESADYWQGRIQSKSNNNAPVLTTNLKPSRRETTLALTEDIDTGPSIKIVYAQERMSDSE